MNRDLRFVKVLSLFFVVVGLGLFSISTADAAQDNTDPVIIKGVTVRGWDPEKKEAFLSDIQAFAEVTSEQELENFATGVLLKDENIEGVIFNPREIQVSYRASGKFLGFIPITFIERVVAADLDLDGDIDFSVRLPWYGFLINPDIKAEEIETESKDKHKNDIAIESWSFGVQSSVLNTISNVLKTKHDTVKNSIGNIR